MFDNLGAFLPIENKRELFLPYYYNTIQDTYKTNKKGPFFTFEQDDDSAYTMNRFLEAIKCSALEDAMAYISKNYVDKVDLSEISNAFTSEGMFCSKVMAKADFSSDPKNCTKNTFMMVDEKGKNTSVFHIYMLNEPDMFGKWKIYGIEQE